MAGELRGIIPPMTTPFNANGELDGGAVRARVRRLLDTGGSTGEGQTPDQDGRATCRNCGYAGAGAVRVIGASWST